ncbi:MAG: alpha/beta hydrolase [Gammaproteobacteria bacterium]|nr:MAG: alpha/beta hydrolase [Gammaproteobacteria bacterium]
MSEAPFWFDRALAAPSEPGDVMVEGASIHYETWGKVGNTGIALVHGSNAHLEWFRFVAPFLADQFRVVALDSSGNGDSGWRERYAGELLADEVATVCKAAELGPNPFVVGHSFGGFTVLETGHYHGKDLGGLIFMDFTTAPPEQYVEWGMRAEREGVQAGRKTRVYEDKATALGRFRYVPEQPVKHPEVLAYIADKSLRQVEGGWTWKFDPALFDYLEMGVDQRDKFAALPCRSAVILGEDSQDEGAFFADHMAEITGGKLPIFKIPGTYHHLTFDEPIAVAMAIKALCLEWIRQDNAEAIAKSLKEVLA